MQKHPPKNQPIWANLFFFRLGVKGPVLVVRQIPQGTNHLLIFIQQLLHFSEQQIWSRTIFKVEGNTSIHQPQGKLSARRLTTCQYQNKKKRCGKEKKTFPKVFPKKNCSDLHFVDLPKDSGYTPKIRDPLQKSPFFSGPIPQSFHPTPTTRPFLQEWWMKKIPRLGLRDLKTSISDCCPPTSQRHWPNLIGTSLP